MKTIADEPRPRRARIKRVYTDNDRRGNDAPNQKQGIERLQSVKTFGRLRRASPLMGALAAAVLFLPLLTAQSSDGAASANAAAGSARQWATNLGRQILSGADLVIAGTLSRNVARVGNLSKRDIVIERVLYGECALPQISVVFSDSGGFHPDDRRVMVALKAMGAGGGTWQMIARRMRIDDERSVDGIAEYIAVERKRGLLSERLEELKTLLLRQLPLPSAIARAGSVELIFFVREYPEAFTHEDYLAFRALAPTCTPEVAADIHLALSGLVESALKAEAQVLLTRGDDAGRLAAMRRLEQYARNEPRAFGEGDIERYDFLQPLIPPALAEAFGRHRTRVESVVREERLRALHGKRGPAIGSAAADALFPGLQPPLPEAASPSSAPARRE